MKADYFSDYLLDSKCTTFMCNVSLNKRTVLTACAGTGSFFVGLTLANMLHAKSTLKKQIRFPGLK